MSIFGSERSRDYSAKQSELAWSEIALPEGASDRMRWAFGDAAFLTALAAVRAEAPASGLELSDEEAARAAWARVSEALWRNVESTEQRLNKFPWKAQFARTVIIGLPAELSRAAQVALMQGYVKAAYTDRGMVADWVLHDKGDGNPHVHVMLTLRALEPDGWGRKERSWNAKSLLGEWRPEWARHANLALERAGFAARIDHRSYREQGLELEPESHDPHVAAHAERTGEIAREAARVQQVRRRNQEFLRAHPDQILVILQARQAVFTEADIRQALHDRLSDAVDAAAITALGDSVMGSPELLPVVARGAQGEQFHMTSGRARQAQQLVLDARLLSESLLEAGAGADVRGDAFESGSGPILITVHEEGAGADGAGTDAAAARSGARRRVSAAAVGAVGASGRASSAPRGPSAKAVREALRGHAEALFRAAFGEPLRPGASEWRAKENEALAMQMRGPRRGLWMDHTAGTGGDLLDLIAVTLCGLGSARSDFPRVLEEASRFAGLAMDGVAPDMASVAMRQALREKAADAEERREVSRKAALVQGFEALAGPVADSPAASYLASRGITELPAAGLAWLPAVAGHRVHGPEHGALVVWAVDDAGTITGGQRILVGPDGSGADVDVRKPAFGMIGGHPARFPGRSPRSGLW